MKKKCISIGPFGSTLDEQGIRHDLEIVLEEALTAQYEYSSFTNVPKIDMAGDIFSALIESDLVVADLRGLNPNVMYELGLRHAFNKPVLHLIDQNTEAPWDIDKNYIITYRTPLQISHKPKLVDDIKNRVSKILQIPQDDSFNTFHAHYKKIALVGQFKGDSDTKNVLDKLENLSSTVSRITSIQKSPYQPDFNYATFNPIKGFDTNSNPFQTIFSNAINSAAVPSSLVLTNQTKKIEKEK